MAETVTRKVLIDGEVQTVTLQKVDPKELREKNKAARLAALKEAETKTPKKQKAEDKGTT